MSGKKPTVGRREFVHGLMTAGFRYDKAVEAYKSVMSTFADGIVSGQKVCFGNVGNVTPMVSPPRHVNMGCMKKKGGEVIKIRREYFLDARIRYKFRIHKKFLASRQLSWQQ